MLATTGEVTIKAEYSVVACGVAVIVTRGRSVLFGRRAEEGTGFAWQLPGGWIEPGEAPPQAARREVREETGLELRDPVFVGVTSNLFSTGRHSISLYFEAECTNAGSLVSRETDNCPDWDWKTWSKITENLYLPLRLLKQTDYQPFLTDRGRTYISF